MKDVYILKDYISLEIFMFSNKGNCSFYVLRICSQNVLGSNPAKSQYNTCACIFGNSICPGVMKISAPGDCFSFFLERKGAIVIFM